MPLADPQVEMLAIACPECGGCYREVSRPQHARDLLDAFYAAIPEKFGHCDGKGGHSSCAAGTVLRGDDLLWLRGIAAVLQLAEEGARP